MLVLPLKPQHTCRYWDGRLTVHTRDYECEELDLAGNRGTGSLMVGKKYR